MMKRLRRILEGFGLIAGGVLLTLALLTLLMMLFPRPFVGAIDYYERTEPNLTRELFFRNIDGDLFVAMPGRVRPPEREEMLAQFVIGWDADGFRVSETPADTYPIAAFGDSFTEAVNVARPWTDILAAELGVGVRNYGYRAYGPLEVARAAREVLAREPRDWAIYAYFSGNDLGDALHGPKVDTRSPLAVWRAFLDRFTPTQQTITPQPQLKQDGYDYPMPVIIGGNYYELAFLPYYWWWHVGTLDVFNNSRNFAVFNESLDAFAAAAESETCKLLVFIPTKEQLYYRYIHPDERQWIRAVGSALMLPRAGEAIVIQDAPFTEAEEAQFLEQLYGQRDAVQALIESKPEWRFLDLLPAFEAAVAEGRLLYYPYDTHWNQDGHTLAAQTIAEYMRAHPECDR